MKKPKAPKGEIIPKTDFGLEVHTFRGDLAGHKLVDAAITQFQEKKKAEILRLVEILLERVQCLDRILQKANRQRDLTLKQLAAVERGEFRISETQMHGFRLHFTDPEIDIDWDSTAHW